MPIAHVFVAEFKNTTGKYINMLTMFRLYVEFFKNKIFHRRGRGDAEKIKKTLAFLFSAVAFPLRLCVLCGQWFLFFFIKVKQSLTYKQNRANVTKFN